MKVEVSVVVPVCGRLAQLKQTLESVLKQSYKDFEVIIVENNSDKPELIENYVSSLKDKRFKFYSLKNCANANVARNYGASISIGKYIAFLDSDDIWDRNHLSSNLKIFIESKENIDFIYSGAKIFDGKNYYKRNSRAIKINESAVDYLVGFGRGYAQTSSFVLLKESFDRVKWDPKLKRAQDLDFFIRANDSLVVKNKPEITSIIVWLRNDVRNYNIDSMLDFYYKYKYMMSNLSKIRYFLICIKTAIQVKQLGILLKRIIN